MPASHLLASIHSYHAHIYFEGSQQHKEATRLRDEMRLRFYVEVGCLNDLPIGPYTRPMFTVCFNQTEFATIVPWLMLNRTGLTVLIHPNTRQPKDDHVKHAMWMGEVLEIKEMQFAVEGDAHGLLLAPSDRKELTA